MQVHLKFKCLRLFNLIVKVATLETSHMFRNKWKGRKRYLGLEVKDMVGDCKVVFQPAQEGAVRFLPIMMRIEDTKCYDDVEDVLLHIIL